MEKSIRYIPNTAEDCPTCQESYWAQAFLVSANLGQLYALDVFVEGFSPDTHYGATDDIVQFHNRGSICFWDDNPVLWIYGKWNKNVP